MNQEAKNIERFSVVQLENGKIGMFERKNLTVIIIKNNEFIESYKVKSTDKLKVIETPVTLAKYYIEKKINDYNQPIF